MIHLLDVNVLIALLDTLHPQHEPATTFFMTEARTGWATCPLTENGVLRILGSPAYAGGSASPQEVRRQLEPYFASPGHVFWPDDVSLADTRLFPSLPGSKHLTDYYLLALAVKHGGRFATFDRGIDASLIPGGPAAYHPIPLA